MAEDRVGELARGRERLVAVAELLAEEVVDGGEHLGPRAVVLRQRQPQRRALAALAEDRDVGVPEAVDRLELVADEEHIARAQGSGAPAQQVDDVALQPVRVLELVDHDRAEAQLLRLADLGVVAQQVARVELEVLEVERRLARLRGGVLGREEVEQLLQQLAVARGELVERRLLEPVARAAELGRCARLLAARCERSSSCSGFGLRASAACAAASCLSVASGSATSACAAARSSARRSGDARRGRRARARRRGRPSGASRRRR